MQFTETYRVLSNRLNFHGSNMKYSTWRKKPEDLKAAYLYVNFFKAVQSAWYRKKQFEFIDEAEAVSLCFQYLQKNVSKIENDPKRYTSSYVYTVCLNCMSILHWRKKDRARYKTEVSVVVKTDCGELFDILSVVPDTRAESYNLPEFEYSCKGLVESLSEDLGPKYEKLAYFLAYGSSLRAVSKRSANYDINPLSKVSVSKSEVPAMIKTLKEYCVRYVVLHRPDLVKNVQ